MPRGLGHIYLRGKIWWIKYYVSGKPHAESSQSEVKQVAVKLLKKRLGRPKSAISDDRLTVSDLMDALDANHKLHRPKSYETFTVPVAKHLVRGLGALRAVKVSGQILRDYIAERQEENASNASINRELGLLRRAYHLARAERKIDLSDIPTFPHLQESEARRGFVEPEQYDKLMTAMPEALKPALVVGYHTGLRKAKVLGLRLDQFDLERKKLYLDPEMNAVKKVPAEVPLYGEMYEFCREYIRRTREELPNCRWFCHRANGDPVMELRPAWDDACKEAGFPGLLFHDLRRSAVRNMVRAGIPEAVAMKISGHKTASVFQRYNIVSGKDIDEAGEKLEAYLGKKTKGAGR